MSFIITISLSIPKTALSCLAPASETDMREEKSSACFGTILMAAYCPVFECLAIFTRPYEISLRRECKLTAGALTDGPTDTPWSYDFGVAGLVGRRLPTSCCCLFLEAGRAATGGMTGSWRRWGWRLRGVGHCVDELSELRQLNELSAKGLGYGRRGWALQLELKAKPIQLSVRLRALSMIQRTQSSPSDELISTSRTSIK